ncbi:MAG: efflux RND transporter periplasmic adaptor subunit [Pseudomonadales bacterium]|nr:efflux RND transporter periplasmic adaptor subunit [Pseudomonadales bacterium]
MKRVVVPLLIVVAGFGLAALLIATGPRIEHGTPGSLEPLVRVQTVTPRPVQMRASTHGTVVPRTESELVAEVAGRVVEISPQLVAGGFFAKGERLLRIDPLDYEFALEQARAGAARAESELANARRAHERQVELRNRQMTSDAQVDDAVNRLRLAEASLREATARVALARRDLERTTLLAPYDGRVRVKRVDLGQFVGRGGSIATIYATDYAEVRLPIHDGELRFLDIPLGSAALPHPVTVELTADFAGGTHTWRGEVVRSEGEIDAGTRMIHLVARVPAPYAGSDTGNEAGNDASAPLAVGLFVRAEILGRTVDDVIALPRAALRGNSDQVYVVDAENRLRFRNVEVLRVVDEQAFINGGLAPGERVCISSLGNALDGMPVRIVSADTADMADATP